MKRGTTLIELMITVAIIGIAGGVAFNSALILRGEASDVTHRERALQALEYEASALISHATVDREVLAKLLAEIPEAKIQRRLEGPATILTVSWKAAGTQRQSRSLALLLRGR